MKKLFFAIAVLFLTASCANIHDAVTRGEVAKVTEIIEDGASVNKRDDRGMTPLMMAASSNQPQMIDLLLAKGADPAAKDNQGRTALWHAMSAENTAGFVKILERGAPTDGVVDGHDPGALPPAKLRLFRLAAEHDLVQQIKRRGDGDLRLFDTYFSKFPRGRYLVEVEKTLGRTIAADWRDVEKDGSVGVLQRFIDRYGQLGQRSFLVTASMLNIRSANSTDASKVGEYEKGDVIYAEIIQDDWIQTDRGWVSRAYLKQIRRRIPAIVPYIEKASAKIESARKIRVRAEQPPARRIAPKVRKKSQPTSRPETPAASVKPAPQPKPTPQVKPTAPTPTRTASPEISSNANKELDAILARPTLEALEAFIIKYKDQADKKTLVTRARREYRAILLGE